MKHEVKIGQTDYTVLVFIPDSASTDGSGKTGLVAANLTVSGVRVETDNDVTVIDYTSTLNNLAALTTAHTDWGLFEISNTLAPGLYRLDIADAIFATGAWSAVVYVMVTTSAAAASPMEFVLVPDAPVTGVNVSQWNGTAVATPATAGIPDINVKNIDNDAASASGTVTFPNATIASTVNITAGVITTVTNLTNAATSGDLTATMKASVNTEADTAITDAALATAANLSTVAGYIDTEVAAIKTQTDKFVFTVANKVDANVLNVAGTAASATNLGKTSAAIGRGTVAALSTTTSIITSAFSPAGISIDQFKGRVVLFDIDTTTTALRGQARTITGSTAASLAVLTVDALTDAPVATDTFSIV